MDPLWPQNYDPLHSAALSTVVAALPVVVLLGSIAVLRIRIHFAALIGLGTALDASGQAPWQRAGHRLRAGPTHGLVWRAGVCGDRR